MNTLKTNLGIEYDIEIVEVGVRNIIINVTCEEGTKEFLLSFDYPLKDDNEFYSQVINNDCSQITNEDLIEAEKWVNEVTVSFISSEVSKLCVKKTNDIEYWHYSIFTLGIIRVSIFNSILSDGRIEDNKESFFANGEKEIKELINKLK